MTGEWKGNIVENFRIEADEEKDTMELYCTLRNNIYWSDGVQMTSDDVCLCGSTILNLIRRLIL